MAMIRDTSIIPLVPMWPGTIDPAEMFLNYDEEADRLTVAFGGAARPCTVDPVDGDAANYLSLRLDPLTEDVVGVELESVALALREHPRWRIVVNAAPTEPAMRRVSPDAWIALRAFVDEAKVLASSGD